MSDGFIVELPYKFILFDGPIKPFDLSPPKYEYIGIVDDPIIDINYATIPPVHLGIGIVDLQIIPASIATTKPEFSGIVIIDEPLIDINYATILPSHLGIGIVDDVTISINLSSLKPSHLGIGIVDAITTSINLSALTPSHLGIGIVDRPEINNNVAILGSVFLGIGIVDNPTVYDIHCGTATSKNLAKKLRFVCAQNTIDIQVPKTMPDNWLFKNLKAYTIVENPINVKNKDNWIADDLRKDKNNPNHPEKEASRLLTHLIFDPIDKPVISTWYLTYTLEIEVEQTDKHDTAHIATPTTSHVFEFNATNSSTIWTIHHQLAFIPTVDVFINNVFYIPKSITHLDTNTTVIKFETAQIGMARFY